MPASPEVSTCRRLPELTDAGLKATANVVACNEFNQAVEGAIAVERALTIYLDKREIVTLMTLGNHPELLILGWLATLLPTLQFLFRLYPKQEEEDFSERFFPFID